VWQAIYRNGPVTREQVLTLTRVSETSVTKALTALEENGRVVRQAGGPDTFKSPRIDIPVGQAQGWEAAVFDHYQAVLSAVCAKLSAGEARSERADVTGGATYSLDLWPGHPMEGEALSTLQRVRAMLEDLRARLDAVNAQHQNEPNERLVFYVGQHFVSDRYVE
jgi:hypothetical protein